jgi:hypothetical protein
VGRHAWERAKGATRSPTGNVSDVSDGRKFVKPVVAALGLAGTIASIWWFALKPRRKRAGERSSPSSAAE